MNIAPVVMTWSRLCTGVAGALVFLACAGITRADTPPTKPVDTAPQYVVVPITDYHPAQLPDVSLYVPGAVLSPNSPVKSAPMPQNRCRTR